MLRAMLLISLFSGLALPSASASEIAQQAHDILRKRCHHCHGGDGSNEGGFGYVLDITKLKQREMVKASRPDQSKLFARIESGEMPEDGALPAAETAIIKKWIQAGAPALESEPSSVTFLSPQQVFQLMEGDLFRIPTSEQKFKRYFSLAHLAGNRVTPDKLALYRQALSKVVNSLSWGNQVVPPKAIDASQTVFRIDLRDYQWSSDTWDKLVNASPYNIVYRHASADFCRRVMQTQHPLLRGDWFVATATVPPLYHEILQIPATEGELEALLGVDAAANIKAIRVVRAGFNGSGVSRNNRLLERHETKYGAYWKSYDFGGNAGRKNLFAHPLGPGGGTSFQHDGGEMIFNLPNGMQGYMLADADGKRIDKGPTAIVSDPKRPDRAVVNGLSCMSCHAKGIIPKSDQVRSATLSNLDLFSEKESQTILAMYAENDRLTQLMQEDSDRFLAALTAAEAETVKPEPVSTLAEQFEQQLDVDLAAAETGLTTEQFLRALDASPTSALAFGPLRAAGGTIQREVFLRGFESLVKELGLQHTLHFDQSGMKLVSIAEGSFTMGSAQDDRLGQPDERNQHRVEITKPFFMSAHEVTVKQYRQFAEETGHKGAYGYQFDPRSKRFIQNFLFDWRNPGFGQTDDHPVINVNWEDANAFCRWMSKREGKVYRLPTEAEWEYACRAGTITRFFSGDVEQKLAGVGNLADVTTQRSLGFGESWDDGQLFTAKVGQYAANDFGLFDMHGNVWEWCQDRYSPDYYQRSSILDPPGPKNGSQRVVRGGSWATPAKNARSAERLPMDPDERNLMIGFRVVREP